MLKELFSRDQSVWDFLRSCEKPIVLYGMGDGADKVLAAFEKYHIHADAVMASDDFVRGQQFRGFTVQRLSDIENQYDDFVVALCFASQLPEVMDAIKAVARKHTTVVPSVPVFGDVLFDDAFVGTHLHELEQAYALMTDEQSRKVFTGVAEFYYTGKPELLDSITTDKDEAFSLLSLGSNEVYVDLGAYNGDTIDEFLHYCGGSYRKIVALEPNAKNFEKLQAHCAGMPHVTLWRLGAWDKNTTLTFNNKAGRNSAVAAQGVQTRVAAVDSILCGLRPTYIKADVEGADYETLLGMSQALTYKPKLNFAAYHRFEDLFRLPMLIHRLNPSYRIYLRHHPYIPAWDTNLYCI